MLKYLAKIVLKTLKLQKLSKDLSLKGSGPIFRQKNCFQRQPLSKYSRQTSNFMHNSALPEKFNT